MLVYSAVYSLDATRTCIYVKLDCLNIHMLVKELSMFFAISVCKCLREEENKINYTLWSCLGKNIS